MFGTSTGRVGSLGRAGVKSLAPSLALDLTAAALDSRITFTRASVANYYNNLGAIVAAASNAARIDYGPSALTSSLGNMAMAGAVVGTPGTMPTGWGPATGNTLAFNVIATGTENGIAYTDIQLVGTASGGGICFIVLSSAIAASIGQTWRNSAYIKLVGGSFANLTAATLNMEEHNAGGGFLGVTSVSIAGATSAGLAKQRFGVTRTMSLAGVAFNYPVLVFNYNNGAVINVTIRIGAPQAVRAPSTPLGLLIEEARTNNSFPSTPVSSSWSVNAGSVQTDNAAVAPDSTVTGSMLADTAATASFRYSPAVVAWVAGTTYAVSMYAKQGTKRYAQMTFNSALFSTTVPSINFDLIAGTVVASTGASATSITPVGDGWYRCTATITADISTTGAVILCIVNSAADGRFQTYLGDGTGTMFFWGAQIEAGVFPTSLITTTAGTATRAAETATMAVGSWYNAIVGTLAADARLPQVNVNANQELIGLEDTSNDAMYIRNGNTSFGISLLAFSGNVNRGSIPVANTIAANTAFKAAFTYNFTTAVLLLALNGGTVATFTATLMPASITKLNIGVFRSNYPNGWIKRIRYWPRVLSNAELQQATT